MVKAWVQAIDVVVHAVVEFGRVIVDGLTGKYDFRPVV
jgi:hypothetical protein